MQASMASCVMVCTWVWLRVLWEGAPDAIILGFLLRMPISVMRCKCHSFFGEGGFFGGSGYGKTLHSKFDRVGVTGGNVASCILGQTFLL